MANTQVPIGTATARIPAAVTDQELLNRYVAGRDEAAFARLVERHGGTIWGVCRRVLQKEHDAEDAYQAVFIVLARKASSIRQGEAVGGWLYRVAYRIAMKARKSLQRRQEAEKQTADFAQDNPPWSEAALREMQRILDEEVDRLAEKFRAPFVLCCLEGMSKPEAARELHWPEETVKARLAQARKLLQSRLARRGITLSAVLTAFALVQSTASAAVPVVAALSAGAGVSLSASSIAMAEGFVSGLALAKFKSAVAVFLLIGMTVAGAGLTVYHFGSDEQAPEPSDAPKAALVFNDPETFLTPPTPVMKPHDEQVLALAISPDGKRLVTAGARPTLPGQFVIWDVENQRVVARKRDLRGIRGVAFSPDGKTVACGVFGGKVNLRDAGTGNDLGVLTGHEIGVNAVAYSADGDLLVSHGLDSLVKVWDVKKLAETKSFAGHTGMVFTVAYFQHGKAIVSGGQDQTAKIWDIDSGKVKFNLTSHKGAVEAVAVSPNDKIVATASWDQTIKLWNAETGKEEAELQTNEGLVLAVAFSHDGTLLASSSVDGSMRIWDVRTRKTIKRLEKHVSQVWSVAFTPNNKILATGSSDATAKLWDVEAGKEIATLTTAELKPVQAIAYSPDGMSLAVAGNDKYVQVRDAKSGDVRLLLAGHADVVNCVAISPDGTTLASGSSDKTIKLWDLATGNEIRTLNGHTGAVLALAFARDGKLASGGEDKLVQWWDLADGQEPMTLKGHEDPVLAIAFASDGLTLASAGGNRAMTAFAPGSGGLAKGGGDRAVRIWTFGKDTPSRVLTGHTGSVRALAFAPDGRLASAGDDAVVKIWEPGANRERHTLGGHATSILSLAFTPGGRTLVSGGANRNVFVWDPVTGKRRGTLSGHKGAVTALAMHPQGDHLITGSADSTLFRWRGAASTTPARTTNEGQSETPIVSRVDAVARVNTDISVPLKGRPDNLPKMKLEGAHVKEWMRFEPTGLRITIPPGFQGMEGHVGFYTGVVLKGDFEATVNYEILKLPEPANAGPETGVTLSAWRLKSNMVITGATRRVVENGVPQFAGWATWFERAGKPSDHKGKVIATEAKTGRLRLLRRGAELSFYASDALDAELTLLNQLSVGAQDMDNLRIIGFSGNPRASLDARFWDLHIRTGAIPRGPAEAPIVDADEPTPTRTGSKGWLAATAVVACLFALLAGLALFLRLRRPTADETPSEPISRKPEKTAPSVSFSCSCGKPLKAKAGLAGKALKCPGCGAPVLVPGKRSG